MTGLVSRAEAQLIDVFRFALGAEPTFDVADLVSRGSTPARALGPTAQRLLHQTLASGAVRSLAMLGGWRPHGGQRLWERTAAPPLVFSGNVVRLGQWLLSGTTTKPLLFDRPPTPAEDLVVALLTRRLASVGLAQPLLSEPQVWSLPLTQLLHHGVLSNADFVPPETSSPVTFSLAYAPFVEGLGGVLKEAWVLAEHSKRVMALPRVLTRFGETQLALLQALTHQFSDQQQHRVLTWFVEAGAQWLAVPRSEADYGHGLDTTTALRDRRAARLASAAAVRTWVRLSTWREQHRAVRFIDDGYDEAQRLLAAWQPMGELGFQAAAGLLAKLEAL